MSGSRLQRSKNRFVGIVLCVLIALAGLSLLVVGLWKLLVVPPDVGGNLPITTPDDSDTQQNDGNAMEDDPQSGAQPDGEEINARKENYYTFLLLGKDTGGGGNTDTMILVSYDVENGTLDLLTIPRDTMINVPWNIKKINAVFASSRGLEGLRKEIGHLTGIVPDFYVVVEWEAIGEIVDALGGIYYDVPYNMDYDDPYQDLHIHQEKGYRLLDGDDAMQVIRWRSNNDDSPYGYHKIDGGIGDTGRQKIQRGFLTAVAQQCLQIKNWTKVSAFAKIFFDNVETDIPWNNLLWFAEQAMGLNMDNIVFHTLPGNDEGWYYTPSLGVNLAYFFADPEGIVELVNAHFNPYTQDITVEDLQIVFKNADASLGVTSGELADPKMAEPSVKPRSAPKSDPDENADSDEEGEPTIPPESGDDTEPTVPPGDGDSVPDSEEGTIRDGELPPEQDDEPTVEGDEPTLPEEPPGDDTDADDTEA